MDIQTKFQTHKDKATQTSEQKQYNEKLFMYVCLKKKKEKKKKEAKI